MKSVLFVLIAAVSSAALAQAPEPFGTISGTVQDSAKMPLPGVTITAMGPGGMATVRTDEQGLYTLSVPPGRYTLTAIRAQFKPSTFTNVAVGSGVVVRMSFSVDALPSSPAPPLRPDRDVMISANSTAVQGDSILYRGNVRMTTNGTILDADELDFNAVTRVAVARGGVTVRVIPTPPR